MEPEKVWKKLVIFQPLKAWKIIFWSVVSMEK